MENTELSPLKNIDNNIAVIHGRFKDVVNGDTLDPLLLAVEIPEIIAEIGKVKAMVKTFKEIGLGIFPEIDEEWDVCTKYLDMIETIMVRIHAQGEHYYLSTGTHA